MLLMKALLHIFGLKLIHSFVDVCTKYSTCSIISIEILFMSNEKRQQFYLSGIIPDYEKLPKLFLNGK